MVSLEELMKAGEELEKKLYPAEKLEREIRSKIDTNILFPILDVAGVLNLSKAYLIKKVKGLVGYNLSTVDREKIDSIEVIKSETVGIVGITPIGIRTLLRRSSRRYEIEEICKDRKRIFCEDVYERKDCNIVRTLKDIGILTNEFFTNFVNMAPRPILRGGIKKEVNTHGRSPLWNKTFYYRIDEAFFNIKEIFNIAMEEKGISMEIDVENLLVKFI